MTSIQFFDKILLPYIESVRASINKSDQKALLISDVFRAQHTQSMKYVNRGVSSDNVQVDTRLTVIRACTLDQRTCYIFEREAGGHKEEMADGTYNSCM